MYMYMYVELLRGRRESLRMRLVPEAIRYSSSVGSVPDWNTGAAGLSCFSLCCFGEYNCICIHIHVHFVAAYEGSALLQLGGLNQRSKCNGPYRPQYLIWKKRDGIIKPPKHMHINVHVK